MNQNLKKKYDVIVVGAGPAGGSCARELAKAGHKVLIIDRAAEIGEPNYSTAGTPHETIEEFNLPKSIIASNWRSVEFRAPSVNKKWEYKKIIGHTLKFRELNQYLCEDAANHGTDILTSTLVEDFLIQEGKICGVKTSDPKNKEIISNMVVDASGDEGKLINKLGLRDNRKIRNGIAYEQWMTGVKTDPSCAIMGFSKKYCPGGYWWVFPTGNNTAKVGVGLVTDLLKKNKIPIPNIKELFLKFTSEFPYFKEAEEIETHIHSMAINNGGIKRYSDDNFIAIGAAAAQVNPLFGEGIRHVMRSGKMAAKIISSAIKNSDFSQKKLADYDKLWKGYIGNKWKFGLWAENMLTHKIDDEYIDNQIKILASLSPKEFERFIWFYELKNIKKMLVENIKNRLEH